MGSSGEKSNGWVFFDEIKEVVTQWPYTPDLDMFKRIEFEVKTSGPTLDLHRILDGASS